METLKNRYKKLSAIDNLIQQILVVAIIIAPIMTIFFNSIAIVLLLVFLFIVFLCSCFTISRSSRKLLNELFTEGWNSGENMLQYGVKLRIQEVCYELLPPLGGIFFCMSPQGNCFICVAFKKKEHTEGLSYVNEITEEEYEIKNIEIPDVRKLEECIEIS